MGNALLDHLPGGEARALHDRPRLVHPHERDLAALVSGADDASGCPVPRGGQRSRIAVGEDAPPVRDERGAAGAHGAVGGDVLVEDRLGLVEQPPTESVERERPTRERHAPHPLQRPEEVDRGGPCRAQPLDGFLEIHQDPFPVIRPTLARRQRDAEGGGHADGGRAAHDEGADGIGDLLPGGAGLLDLLDRQAGLIQEREA